MRHFKRTIITSASAFAVLSFLAVDAAEAQIMGWGSAVDDMAEGGWMAFIAIMTIGAVLLSLFGLGGIDSQKGSAAKNVAWYEVQAGQQDQVGDWHWSAKGRFESEEAARAAAKGMSGVYARIMAIGRDGVRRRVV